MIWVVLLQILTRAHTQMSGSHPPRAAASPVCSLLSILTDLEGLHLTPTISAPHLFFIQSGMACDSLLPEATEISPLPCSVLANPGQEVTDEIFCKTRGKSLSSEGISLQHLDTHKRREKEPQNDA